MKLQQLFKRIIDIIASLSGLIITSPILIIIGILIKIKYKEVTNEISKIVDEQ